MRLFNSTPPKKLSEAFIDVFIYLTIADLIQMSTQHIEGVGNAGSLTAGTIIQPPSHVTLPSVASWFKEDEIH